MKISLFLLSSLVAHSYAFSPSILPSTTQQHVPSITKLFLSTKTEVKDLKSASKQQKSQNAPTIPDYNDVQQSEGGFSYGEFAKQYPFANNIMIATAKTAAADLLAQTVIAQTPLMEVDLQRSFLFCVFGALYLGAFQYAYQVQVRVELFNPLRHLLPIFV